MSYIKHIICFYRALVLATFVWRGQLQVLRSLSLCLNLALVSVIAESAMVHEFPCRCTLSILAHTYE